jgi:Concanavalin A-like lectin/glucanases superfamily/Cohesin domain/Carboxypeptidase regulatory-like domain/Dockerin type I domain
MNSSISKFLNPFSPSIWFRSVVIGIVALLLPVVTLWQTSGHLVKAYTSIWGETVGEGPGGVAVYPLTDKDYDSNRESNTVNVIEGTNYPMTFNGVIKRSTPPPTPNPGTGAIRIDAPGEGISYQSLSERWDSDGVTIMAWVYLANNQDGDVTLFLVRGAGILYLRGGSQRILKIYTGNSQSSTNDTHIPLQEWHHFALVRVGGTRTWRAYLDGVLDFSGDALVEPTDNPLPMFGNNSYGEWLDGRIAAGKIWRATLSTAEIQSEMGSYAPLRTANIWSVVPMRVHTDLTDQSGMGNTPTATGTLSTEEGPPLESIVSLSGHVAYADTVTPGRNVVMALTAPFLTTETTTSDINGNYTFANVSAGYDYTVTPSKTGDVNGISPFDATLVLRDVAAGGGTLSPNQQIAADTNGNGLVTSFDATQILRYVAAGGQTVDTGEAGNWKINPPFRSYAPLLSSIGNENYVAMLVGEVSGNWTPPSVLAEPDQSEKDAWKQSEPITLPIMPPQDAGDSRPDAAFAPIDLSMPTNATASNGSTVVIPVTMANSNTISGYQFAVTFDPTVLQPANPAVTTAGTLSSTFNVVSDVNTSGRLGISAAGGNNTITGAGTLINLSFTVAGGPQSTTNLNFTNIRFEDIVGNQILPVNATNGVFTVLGPTSAGVAVTGRVLSSTGRGIYGARVLLIDPNGNPRRALTNPFGYYRFENLPVGETYVLTVQSKRFTFSVPSRVISLEDYMPDVDFTADPQD